MMRVKVESTDPQKALNGERGEHVRLMVGVSSQRAYEDKVLPSLTLSSSRH